MTNELKLKVCQICGKVVKVEDDTPVMCCGQEMVDVVPNSIGAEEKHKPKYERVEDEIFVKVNHVMEKEHYIEWISMVINGEETRVELFPEQEASARFPYIKGATIYAYCNKHGLWKTEVE